MAERAVPVAVGLGSNLGRRDRHLAFGVRRLAENLSSLRVSRVYETVPAYDREQRYFLNACCTGDTTLTAQQLLSQLQDAERAAGRVRTKRRYGPRPLDLDLLLYGRERIATGDLSVPHPGLRERTFVIVPLAEIAADWIVPASNGCPEETVGSIRDRLGTSGVELWKGPEGVAPFRDGDQT
ncbi:MAG: 2-amino-4-hydroxy-6-hydroxymethyldihydropteridine diphosphokinase [marine benthic group bacterium]|jgi:2-amino-4-hydroxy-6-hydroxymethyldihydropteridine diphosphokinase|nr:2-amino-4-hydroxy-6-hydroxymethyldihydropteridine diphosphokinase [Gemmatimonadota bacterium]